MFVEDHMSANPVTIHENAPLSEAAETMRKRRFRQLPVVDRSERLVGIITDRDLRQTMAVGQPLEETLTVSDAMTAEPMTTTPDATLEEVVMALSTHRFGSLPVVLAGELVGIITYIDVLRAFSELLGLDVEGHRIEVALPDGYADVARAFDSIKNCDGQIISSMVSRVRRDGGEPALYLRVAVGQGPSIERRLRAAALVLLKPEHD